MISIHGMNLKTNTHRYIEIMEQVFSRIKFRLWESWVWKLENYEYVACIYFKLKYQVSLRSFYAIYLIFKYAFTYRRVEDWKQRRIKLFVRQYNVREIVTRKKKINLPRIKDFFGRIRTIVHPFTYPMHWKDCTRFSFCYSLCCGFRASKRIYGMHKSV